jgi:hypothetical protein
MTEGKVKYITHTKVKNHDKSTQQSCEQYKLQVCSFCYVLQY